MQEIYISKFSHIFPSASISVYFLLYVIKSNICPNNMNIFLQGHPTSSEQANVTLEVNFNLQFVMTQKHSSYTSMLLGIPCAHKLTVENMFLV